MSSATYIRPLQVEVLEDHIAPATLIVTNDNDSGAGSLREAIELSNALPTIDTIIFDEEFFSTARTISLMSALPVITGNLIIEGTGPSNIIIDGNGQNRIFNFDDDDTLTTNEISISGLMLSNGNAGSYNGGAIFSKETVTVTDCVISGNQATFGGAIYINTSGNLLIKDTLIANNSSTEDGGGINAVARAIAIIDSLVSGNTTTATGAGGGIYASADEKIVVDNTQFTGNSSMADSGGLYAKANNAYADHQAAESIEIINSLFSENTARNCGGGLLACSGKNLTVHNTDVTDNVASSGNGGGLYLDSLNVSVIDSIISGNVSAEDGADIYAYAYNSILVKDTDATDNNAQPYEEGLDLATVNVSVSDSISSEDVTEESDGGDYIAASSKQ